ncbi:hypothetical protein [Dyadobacter koreensis]|uniref:hypothetical protein n=1 Tax=Dyadobacter koreensis TaxID=408657 RepID=UPI0011606A82|nr:hypothetical protein [Dyadobacter koreensis]
MTAALICKMYLWFDNASSYRRILGKFGGGLSGPSFLFARESDYARHGQYLYLIGEINPR